MVHTGAGKLYLIVHFAGRTEGLVAATDPVLAAEGLVAATAPVLTAEGLVAATAPMLAAEGLEAATAPILTAEGLEAATASTSYGLRLISSKGLRHAAADEGVDD